MEVALIVRPGLNSPTLGKGVSEKVKKKGKSTT
jgi:hypothetical protein